MRVLSLFDGMSCGQQALKNLGIKVSKYLASEVDPHAIKVAMKNHPNTIQLGDVKEVTVDVLGGEIDLLIGGSPCQGFSFAGQQLNFEDERSKLFFEYVRLLEELKPKYFLLENVPMKKEYQDVISKYLGVEPIVINSRLVSAQNRKRLYWTNIPNIEQPEDLGLVLSTVLQPDEELEGKFNLSDKAVNYMERLRNGKPRWQFHTNVLEGEAACLTANMFKGVPYGVIWEKRRFLTPIECERLQGLKDNYTEGVSKTQRLKMLGNGWNVATIEHILKNLKQ